ncbi:hypothetical protein GGR52DRAFT_547731 [Hypoxylon sp. FL1284]|nr:hypothetical protein GGR52DRAFT_547731 [Hypoxylon sp. FL1284]
MASDEWSDPEYDIPLQHKRPFGSGLKRKRVVFVPASDGNLATTEGNPPAKPSQSISDLYLSIVMPEEKTAKEAASTEEAKASASPSICEICQLPVNQGTESEEKMQPGSRPHEASIAHQVCMTHSHPPSALDRSRMGLSVLQTQGWDPDSRKGLGVAQQGMQYPIKATPKNDTLGIGVKVPKNLPMKNEEKVKTYDAKKVRKMVEEDKKRRERLRHQLYGNPDVEKYLGTG